uniref:Ig-like domain-containing protein n=1 Tax=Callorhinchus milii TaxID=7868 RepID=A0A4W3GWS7_CALMI
MGDSVIQSEPSVTATEGGQVTLHSDYSTSLSSYCSYWYRQRPENQPEYILRSCSGYSNNKANFAKIRFSDELQISKKSSKLTISQLEMSDSVLYSCAFRATVMETSLNFVQKLSKMCEVALRRVVCFQEVWRSPQVNLSAEDSHKCVKCKLNMESNTLSNWNYHLLTIIRNLTPLLKSVLFIVMSKSLNYLVKK